MTESGKDSSSSKSAIANGSIVITDEERQQSLTGKSAADYIASLNRDTDNAHQGPLEKLPDLQDILGKQAELADAAGQTGPAVAQTVGDISEYMYAQTKDESWNEGGLKKTILQAAGAAIVAELGNGEGLNAALGAAASQLAAKQVDELSREIGGSTGGGALKNIISNVISGAIGMAAGGESGATSASTMDRYNRQMHPDQLGRLAALCNANPEKCDAYRAAACALTDCGTDLPDGDPFKERLMLLEQLGGLAELDEFRNELAKGGMFDLRDGDDYLTRMAKLGEFYYTYYFDKDTWRENYVDGNEPASGQWDDTANAWASRNDEALTRVTGVIYTGIGAGTIVLGVGGSEISAGSSLILTGVGSYMLVDGSYMAVGPYQSSQGADIINALNNPSLGDWKPDVHTSHLLNLLMATADLAAIQKALPKGALDLKLPSSKQNTSFLDDLFVKPNTSDFALDRPVVQSRINLTNKEADGNGGWLHVVDEHYSGSSNKSQFTIDQGDLRTLLQSTDVVHSPVLTTIESIDKSGNKVTRYVREVELSKPIGTDMFNNHKPTSVITILTDRQGNLITTFPGKLK